MSGITPLLDTVLHEVLGKRVDTQSPRDLNQPVKALSAEGALKPLHSDSRLDTRDNSTTLRDVGRAPRQIPSNTTPTGQPPSSAPASTQTHLSGSARAIADLLTRFSPEPSTLKPQAPLITDREPPTQSNVANRLEQSIRLSGLFYESHLARWYKGEHSRQQLAQEPQMTRAAPQAREMAADAPPRSSNPPTIPEGLQGIVRHQLEMLVTPVMRWEGDVWSGLFMALMIQPPDERREHAQRDEHESAPDDPESRAWRSSIDVEIAEQGRLTASLWMQSDRVAIDLGVANPAFLEQLETDIDALRSRLAGHGFSEIHVDVHALDEGSHA